MRAIHPSAPCRTSTGSITNARELSVRVETLARLRNEDLVQMPQVCFAMQHVPVGRRRSLVRFRVHAYGAEGARFLDAMVKRNEPASGATPPTVAWCD